MKPRSRMVTGVLVALAMAASLTFALAAPLGAQTSDGQYAGMYVDQTPKVVDVGDTFTTNVMVTYDLNPAPGLTSAPVTEGEAHINFDPTKLEVLGITPGTELWHVVQSNFDNVAGTIDFKAEVLEAPAGLGATSQFLLCSLELKAKGLTNGSPLLFVFQGPNRITDVVFYGHSVLDRNRVYNGNVIVKGQRAPSIPSVSQWGAIGMGTVMAGMLVWRLRRKDRETLATS